MGLDSKKQTENLDVIFFPHQACTPTARSTRGKPPSDTPEQTPRNPCQTSDWWSSRIPDGTPPTNEIIHNKLLTLTSFYRLILYAI